MAELDVYRAKRNFRSTSEPAGAKRPTRAKGLAFVIQKHAATRLHYDLRLELDGVLKSWAVTRGPSLVPGEKRLAVHVEDHPMDYGSFEGQIPEGNYGAGEVIVWDRGEWIPEGDPHKGYAKGHLDFTLKGEKLSGGWHLVRIRGKSGEKRENWLLIKSRDEASREVGDPEIVDEAPRSVISGRTVEDVAGPGGKAGRGAKAAARREQAEAARATPAPKKAPAKAATSKAATSRAAEKPRARAARPAARKPSATKEEEESGGGTLPAFIAPCLAELRKETPDGDSWVHEIKFDGYRMQARVDRGRVALKTRSGLDWTDKFGRAEALRELAALPCKTALIDGELVVEAESGASDFSALQADLGSGRADRLVYFAFDLLHLDGVDLTRQKLLARKAKLEELLGQGRAGALRYSEHMEEGGPTLLRHACRLSLEGVVSKRRDAPYRSGRTGDWVKSKCAARQEFVIGGYTRSTTARRAVGALAVGAYQDGRLVYAGKVGSGLSEAASVALWDELERLRADAPPFAEPLPAEAKRGVRWVRPTLVAEVEFRGWTAGASLRHPVFHGLRRDKPASEVVRELAADPPAPASVNPAPATRIRLTHPDRVLWPDAGVTKQGLADFYLDAWRWIAPFVVDRPLSLVRCPGGVGAECFFQKHAWAGLDKSVERLPDGQGDVVLVIRDVDGLMALVQAGVLEIHPWGSRIDAIERPDMLTFDLDPAEDVDWERVIAGALAVRDRLAALGLRSFVKTTGGKGLHVVVPIRPENDWETAKTFARSIAEGLAKDEPNAYTAQLAKARRQGRIFVDFLRNGRGATAIGAYSTRARPGAPVATPLDWSELGPAIRPDRFRVGNLLNRLDSLRADPWGDFFKVDQALPAPGARAAAPRGRGRL
ncbi:DNA ligase D [Alsobacter sp. SYSU M60028]|uniref:DNA ligase (ATP) n=1 Tax=Alsobacter ponti TaxID=2962936 RepID=A0ABT1L727_9HYPH|nr:DNA ligase D [Alsobacter ponti]